MLFRKLIVGGLFLTANFSLFFILFNKENSTNLFVNQIENKSFNAKDFDHKAFNTSITPSLISSAINSVASSMQNAYYAAAALQARSHGYDMVKDVGKSNAENLIPFRLTDVTGNNI